MPKPYTLASLSFSLALIIGLATFSPALVQAKTVAKPAVKATVVITKTKAKPAPKKSTSKKVTAKKTTIRLYGVNYKVKAADAWKYNKKTAPVVRDSLEAAEEARERALLSAILKNSDNDSTVSPAETSLPQS